ncbi:MAG: GntR family transcriptional regulator [Anaerolineae bacterium]|nr:GntR family transcriptional regulator [Anaerolineae bacterium]
MSAQADNLSEQVYKNLKEQIIERQLHPGTKLDIKDLSEKMRVSRMPLLDAITRLKAEGLVRSRQRVGTYVTPLDETMFEEIFEARNMIEYWIAPHSILHIRDIDVQNLEKLLQQSGQLVLDVDDESFDYRRFIELDQEFHLRLIQLCGNNHIIAMYRSLNSHIQIGRAYSLRALDRSREGQVEHEAILSAYASRDVKEARSAQLAHSERSRAGVMTLLKRYGPL